MTSHVLIIGGASRNEEIIHHLLDDGYIISLLGYEQLHMQDEKL